MARKVASDSSKPKDGTKTTQPVGSINGPFRYETDSTTKNHEDSRELIVTKNVKSILKHILVNEVKDGDGKKNFLTLHLRL